MPMRVSPQVLWLEQQVAKRRTKRDAFIEPTDPKFPQQWYLVGEATALGGTGLVLSEGQVGPGQWERSSA